VAHDENQGEEPTREELVPDGQTHGGGEPLVGGRATPVARGPDQGLLPRGATVGRYVILDLVGAGGMGRVYSAYDPQLDRRLALKLMIGGRDPNNRQRLLREARALARVQHPSVVGVHDAGEVGDQVFIAMDLVEGTTLSEWLKRQPRPPAEILATFQRAGEGLAAAHAAGLVHRDFKPANVLIGARGQVAVTDFGLAREVAATGGLPGQRPAEALPPALRSGDSQSLAPLTQAGVVSGTPQFMAPEQFAGQPVDARADQFAFCVALWDALYGRPPYPAETVQELVNRIARGDLAQPADHKKVPNHVHKALERGLAPRAEARWPSMDALLRHLTHDAGRGRRWARLGAIALLTLAVGAVGWYRLSGARQRACAATLERFTAVWTPETRRPARDAFLAVLPVEGPATWDMVEAAIDVWAGNWRDAQRDICAANTGGLLDNQLERQLGCLEELRLSQQALVTALARVDRGSAQAANDAVGALPLPRTCATSAVPIAATGPRAEVRAHLAEAAVLNSMHKAKEGEAGALEAVALARKADLPDEESRAWMQVAVARGILARFDEAEAAVVEATLSAERAGQFRDVAFAWAERMYVAAVYQAQWQKAEEAGRHAEIWADRVGGDRFLTARIEGLRGVVLVQTGHPAQALEHLRRAVQAGEEQAGKDHLTQVRTLMLLTNAARAAGELDEALEASASATAIQEKHLPAIHPSRAHVLNARGRVLFAAGRNAEALEAHRKARELFEAAVPGAHPESAKTLAMIGEVLRADGDVPAAGAAFKDALKQASSFGPANHPLRGQLERDVGRLAALAADEREAAESFQRALAAPWPKADQVQLWTDAAQAWLHLTEWRLAETAATSGLAVEESAALHFILAQAHWGLGETGLSDEALAKARASADAGFVVEIDRWVAARPKPPKPTRPPKGKKR
jgi:eukaryotic-like serine/threonine-protein kinase